MPNPSPIAVAQYGIGPIGAEIARLLPQLSSAMVDEVEALAALEAGAVP